MMGHFQGGMELYREGVPTERYHYRPGKIEVNQEKEG